ncbi:hypothetical protein [Thalassotalea sp. PP2-459]|uniref:hypothetical protein n=1 Tax=Thalassotalea sp. PP2-459 TaxID=1742724 RepID=UPI00094372CE|nr:hypothetical protein [Thalassotalea sp. PP2-459]OKY26754.1 hypothetical protein BI291_01815 [Thalassotalea sp. PP2-459]
MVTSLFLTLSIFFLFIALFRVYNLGVARLFNSPIVLSTIFFFLIHLMMPLLQWDVSYFRYNVEYDLQPYIFSLLFVALLHAVFIFGLSCFPVDEKPELLHFNLSHTFLKRALQVTTVIFLVGAYYAGKNIIHILTLGYENYITDRISMGVGNGLSLLLAHWTYVSCLLFFFVFYHGKKSFWINKISLVGFIVSLVLAATYYGINSNRNSLFLLIISLLSFSLSFNRKYAGHLTFSQLRKTVSLLFVILSIVFALHTIGKMRSKASTLNTQTTEYGLINSLNGAFGNHENIVWLMENEQDLELGITYLAGFANFIPRSIWPKKPVGAGPRLKNAIYPGSYVVGRKGNSSLTTGLYTELMMNFGRIGALVGSLIFAATLSLMLFKLKRQQSPIIRLIFLFSVVMFSAQFMYAEFLGFFARYIFSIVPFLILYIATRHIKS